MTSTERMYAMTKKERVQKYGEVFTPQRVVDDMCDMLLKENPDCYLPGKTFLEPACGEGVFLLEVLRRKFANCKSRADYSVALKSIYGFEIQADNVEKTIQNITDLCWEYFKPSKDDLETIKNHIIMCDGIKVMKMLAEAT